jgi:hypothetical protein
MAQDRPGKKRHTPHGGKGGKDRAADGGKESLHARLSW